MAKNPLSKDDSLEALDFIINVLKEHEKDLDKLITQLATVTEQLGEAGEISGKVEKLEEKITTLQKEVTSVMSYISSVGPKEASITPNQRLTENTPAFPDAVYPAATARPSVILRCKQWEDFQSLASQAQTLSFTFKEDEKSFQADALKGNQIVTYNGAMPKFTQILKVWLSKELSIPEKNILEGALAIG